MYVDWIEKVCWLVAGGMGWVLGKSLYFLSLFSAGFTLFKELPALNSVGFLVIKIIFSAGVQ